MNRDPFSDRSSISQEEIEAGEPLMLDIARQVPHCTRLQTYRNENPWNLWEKSNSTNLNRVILLLDTVNR